MTWPMIRRHDRYFFNGFVQIGRDGLRIVHRDVRIDIEDFAKIINVLQIQLFRRVLHQDVGVEITVVFGGHILKKQTQAVGFVFFPRRNASRKAHDNRRQQQGFIEMSQFYKDFKWFLELGV